MVIFGGSVEISYEHPACQYVIPQYRRPISVYAAQSACSEKGDLARGRPTSLSSDVESDLCWSQRRVSKFSVFRGGQEVSNAKECNLPGRAFRLEHIRA